MLRTFLIYAINPSTLSPMQIQESSSTVSYAMSLAVPMLRSVKFRKNGKNGRPRTVPPCMSSNPVFFSRVSNF